MLQVKYNVTSAIRIPALEGMSGQSLLQNMRFGNHVLWLGLARRAAQHQMATRKEPIGLSQ